MTHATRRTLLQVLAAAGTLPGRAIAADANVYPLPQPAGSPPFTLGNGPDSVTIIINADASHSFAVLLDQKPIAGPLIPGNGGNISFTIRGSWGPQPQAISLVPTIARSGGRGLAGIVVQQVEYNFLPLSTYVTDSTANGWTGWSQGRPVWDRAGTPLNYVVPPASATPAPPPPVATATDTAIAGATINGAAVAPATLAKIIAKVPAGGTLRLPAGTIVGTSGIPVACTISGAGMGRTILDATGIAEGITAEKGVLVPLVPGVVIADMTIKGAEVSDKNGAAVRDSRDGIGFTLRNVEVTGCQMGILTFASNIVLDSCNFHDNGAGAGQFSSHEMYVNGAPNTSLTLNNTSAICGTKSTHAVKSRAGTTRITGGTLSGNPDASADSVGGSVVDIPNGGVVAINGTTLIITAKGADANTLFLGYAMEFGNNQTTGNTVTLSNVHLIDKSGTGGIIEAGAKIPTARLVIGPGCVYDGTRPPLLKGWAATTGAFARSGR